MVKKAGDLERALEKAVAADKAKPAKAKKKTKKEAKLSQASKLAQLVEDNQLFHDESQDCYCRVPVDRHFETHRLGSKSFKRWLSGTFFMETGQAPSSEAMNAAQLNLEARAIHYGDCREVSVRISGGPDAVYIDLGGEGWDLIEIDQTGWSTRNDAPVAMHRPPGMRPLPYPAKQGDIALLRDFLNVNDADFTLAVAFIIGAYSPKGPYPALIMNGEHGSAKSSAARIIRSLIDPGVPALRAAPRNEQDLMIAAANAWTVCYDNLGTMPLWLSDALCRLSTGGGFGCKMLYTDKDEALFDVQRPSILNGISGVVSQPDLADRSIFIRLRSIPDGKRLSEKELNQKYDKAAPIILAGIFDAISEALRNLPNTKITSLPRMADFALWVAAAEPALPWDPGYFLELYGQNRADVVATTLDSSRLGSVFMAWAKDVVSIWEGTSSELLEKLEDSQTEATIGAKDWPKSPSALSRKLAMLASFLRRAGIDIDLNHRIGASRAIRIIKMDTEDVPL